MSKLTILPLLAAASYSGVATTNGTGVDLSDFTGSGTLMLDASAVTGTGATVDVKLQHSDTLGGTYTDVGISFPQLTVGPAQNIQQPHSLDRYKKFVRAVVTTAGTSPAVVLGLYVIGNKAL